MRERLDPRNYPLQSQHHLRSTESRIVKGVAGVEGGD